MNLFWREGVELPLDRVFPLLASHSFRLPFSRRRPHSPLFTPAFLIGSQLLPHPALYIDIRWDFFLPNQLVPERSTHVQSFEDSFPFKRLRRIRSCSVLSKAAHERRDYVYIYPKNRENSKGREREKGREIERENNNKRSLGGRGTQRPRELNDKK